jgi:undecaprenyl-diphosphatase
MGLYYKHVWQMILGLFGKSAEGLYLLLMICTAFLPAAIMALTLEKWIKSSLFGIAPVITAWIVGGVIILAIVKRSRPQKDLSKLLSLHQLTWRMALIIGLLQCVAMWPGTSRSLMTIAAGLLVGLRPKDAVEFSFLLGVLTLGAATSKDTLEYGSLMLESFGLTNLIVGFLASTISAALAVKWLVSYLQKHGMAVFGYYRIVIGLVALALCHFGILRNAPVPNEKPIEASEATHGS